MTFKSFSYFVLIVSTLIFSCSKSGNTKPPSTNSFTWTTGGKNYSATIDTAFLGTNILGTPFHLSAGFGTFPSGYNGRIDFHLTSFNVGTYSITPSPATVNTLRYIDDAGFILEGISGALNITANSNNFLSGNFSITLINPSMVASQMTGSFTDVSIRP